MKKFCTLLCMLFVAVCINAYDVVVDNACYNLNKENKTAEVTEDPTYTYQYTGDIVIPEKINVEGTEYTVTSVGKFAFFYALFMNTLTLPETIESIGESAISYCDALQSITVPSKVKTIGDYAFSDNKNLEEIILPEGVEEIGRFAFYNLPMLSTITLPSTIKKIGERVFEASTGLTEIHSRMVNPVFITRDAFDVSVFEGSTLYVPKGTKKTYMETMYWDLFINMVEEEVAGIEDVFTKDANEEILYDLQGRRVYTPVKGQIYIENGKKIIK